MAALQSRNVSPSVKLMKVASSVEVEGDDWKEMHLHQVKRFSHNIT